MRPLAAIALALLLAAAGEVGASSRYLPHLAFRVLATPHFRIYYHQGGLALAQRLAGIAESVHAELPARLRLRAPSTTHVVLADQDDSANGWAIPLPYNTISLTVVPPAGADLIGHTSDWLRLVFTHEYAHILQLDQSAGWAAGIRRLLGRSPLAFPNLALPAWQIEGFATYVESRETREGRLRAGDARALVQERIRRIGPEPLDRLNGGATDWPGGIGPYLYGGFFTDYLAQRFGEEKLGEITRRTAGRLPFASSGAFKKTYGRGLRELWTDFQQEMTSGPPASAGEPVRRRLTHEGFLVSSPRFSPDGTSLVYAVRTPHEFPSLETRPVSGEQAPRTLALRYGGEGISIAGDLVYFDQLEVDGNVALRADLFVASTLTGHVHRLTRGGRLLDPAVSPDGRRLVAVRAEGGRRVLAWFDVEPGPDGVPRLVPSTGDAEAAGGAAPAVFGSPRWSPDGRWVAAERRFLHGDSEIVALDAETGRIVVLATSSAGRNVTPAWTPDGRSVLFASDRDGRVFQIYSVPVTGGPPARVTFAPGGAMSPEVSPDGRHLVYVGYTEDGYDLFETILAPTGPTGSDRPFPVLATLPQAAEAPPTAARDGGYSPLPTLLPRAWTPVADSANDILRLGAATWGVDVLGRHAWNAAALWRIGGEADTAAGRDRATPDWSAGYTYDRWLTPFFVAASSEMSFLPLYAADGSRLPAARLNELELSLGAALPRVRTRHVQLWQAAFNYDRQSLDAGMGAVDHNRHSVRGAWLFSGARMYGYSISPEEGFAVSVTTEQVRRTLGADGNAQAWTARLRAYRRLGTRHSVLAARAGAGLTDGDRRVRRTFYLGGPDPDGPLVDFGSDALAMLRGVEDLAYSGRRVLSGTLEYRVPLLRIQRGWRSLPVFLETVHAAVFADTGHAWDQGFSWTDLKTSVGAEVSLDLVAGFNLPLTLSAGVAWARDGATARRFDAAPYVRLGRSF